MPIHFCINSTTVIRSIKQIRENINYPPILCSSKNSKFYVPPKKFMHVVVNSCMYVVHSIILRSSNPTDTVLYSISMYVCMYVCIYVCMYVSLMYVSAVKHKKSHKFSIPTYFRTVFLP